MELKRKNTLKIMMGYILLKSVTRKYLFEQNAHVTNRTVADRLNRFSIIVILKILLKTFFDSSVWHAEQDKMN